MSGLIGLARERGPWHEQEASDSGGNEGAHAPLVGERHALLIDSCTRSCGLGQAYVDVCRLGEEAHVIDGQGGRERRRAVRRTGPATDREREREPERVIQRPVRAPGDVSLRD